MPKVVHDFTSNPLPDEVVKAVAHLPGRGYYADELARRAEALAGVQQMSADLAAAHETIGQLKADLAREQDRCAMLDEERRRYRGEALVFRSKLLELATAMANIGLLTLAAQDMVKTVHELTTEADTPTDSELVEIEKIKNGIAEKLAAND